MFMTENLYEHNDVDNYIDASTTVANTAEETSETDDYQELLNTADAARAGLASDEHDYDYIEDESL